MAPRTFKNADYAAKAAAINAMGGNTTKAEVGATESNSDKAVKAGYAFGTLAHTVVVQHLNWGGQLGDHELYLALGSL